MFLKLYTLSEQTSTASFILRAWYIIHKCVYKNRTSQSAPNVTSWCYCSGQDVQLENLDSCILIKSHKINRMFSYQFDHQVSSTYDFVCRIQQLEFHALRFFPKLFYRCTKSYVGPGFLQILLSACHFLSESGIPKNFERLKMMFILQRQT